MTRFLAVQYLILVIGTLLPIMNPFSTAPLFIALSSGRTIEDRNRQAMLACIYSFGILVTFLLAGRAIIQFFGISLHGIRVAGGLLIASLGFRMVFGSSDVRVEGAGPQPAGDIAFTPLAMPSLSGPGSISVVLTMSSEVPTKSTWSVPRCAIRAFMSAQYCGSAYSSGLRSLPLFPRPAKSGQTTRLPPAARRAARWSKSRPCRVRPWTQTTGGIWPGATGNPLTFITNLEGNFPNPVVAASPWTSAGGGFTNDPRYENPLSHQWNLEIQRQLSSSMVLAAA